MRLLCCLLMLCAVFLSGCGGSKGDATTPIKKLDETVTLTGDADAPMANLSQDAPVAAIRALGGSVKFNRTQVALRGSKVTDAGLMNLKALTSLRSLFLNDTQVTDAGLVHLKGLTSLYELSLQNANVTDAGLVHLKGLTDLQSLSFENTQVTDGGVKDLQAALPNCRIRK